MLANIFRPPARTATLIFVLLCFVYSWPIDRDPGANVRAHLDQAFAIASAGTLAIDAFMSPRPNTVDWSLSPTGRYFPAKAPGAAFAATPIAWLLHRFERASGVNPFDDNWFRRNAVVINVALNAV